MANISLRDPFDELARVWPRSFARDWFGRGPATLTQLADWSPTCDVTEKDDAIIVHAELPGVELKDIDLTLDSGVLTIRGEKRTEKKDERDGRTYSERTFGSFQRTIATPAGTDPGDIDATLKDGVLEVRIARKPETPPPSKRIEVKTA